MSIEYIILISAWFLTLISLFIFIPKEKIRLAQVAFLFKQIMTWLIGLIIVEFRLIEYPVRAFKYANKGSFTFEYFVYPAISAIFNVHYPEGKSLIKKTAYYIAYSLPITTFEMLLEQYTDLIEYIKWDWYWTFISLNITFFLSRLYVRWFFRIKS